ncbi:MAG: hypothetical protein AAFR58_20295 [Cyanobacteria bacterium J06627_28]
MRIKQLTDLFPVTLLTEKAKGLRLRSGFGISNRRWLSVVVREASACAEVTTYQLLNATFIESSFLSKRTTTI